LIRFSNRAIRASASFEPLQLCVLPPNCKLKQPVNETQDSANKQRVAIPFDFMAMAENV
jgi:hypothetical protein